MITKWTETNEYDFQEVDPSTKKGLMSSRSIDFAGDFVYDLSNFAIVGNRVYLEAPRGSRAFGGDVGGELYVLDLSTGAVSKLLAYGDEDNGGYLFSSEGHLYRVYTSTTDYIVR